MTEEQPTAEQTTETSSAPACIECNTALTLPEGVVSGEVIDCPDCGVELEVKNPKTGELVVAESAGEDWGE